MMSNKLPDDEILWSIPTSYERTLEFIKSNQLDGYYLAGGEYSTKLLSYNELDNLRNKIVEAMNDMIYKEKDEWQWDSM